MGFICIFFSFDCPQVRSIYFPPIPLPSLPCFPGQTVPKNLNTPYSSSSYSASIVDKNYHYQKTIQKRPRNMMPQRANLHIALTFLQFCYAGNHIFLRIALDGGVSKLIFPVYRNITALVLLAPLAYFSEKYAV